MDRIRINGAKPLYGEVSISGSKNAALPMMTAALLADSPCVIHNIPRLRDIDTMANMLRFVGAEVEQKDDTLFIDPRNFNHAEAPYDMVRKMRASIYVLGPMLAKLRRARVSMPGGCVIGQRPIDIHIRGIKALGAEVTMEPGYINTNGEHLHGGAVSLEGPFGSSVGATCNMVMVAVLTPGTTILRGAAREPEVVDLVEFLNSMGARIKGAGSSKITIEGVDSLHGAEYSIIPDRIEAGTFMIAFAITKGEGIIKGCDADHLDAVITKIEEMGVRVDKMPEGLKISIPGEFQPLTIRTAPYPGFPTDMQAQFTALLSLIKGKSIVTDTIFQERYIHCAELRRMGADLMISGGSVYINGVEKLGGAPVMASDLRASAALVLAGLAAEGTTEILRVYHIDRGYEQIEKKLQKIGADIVRFDPAKDRLSYQQQEEET